MRKNRVAAKQTEISILALDDDEIMTITLQSYFQSSGYHVDIENTRIRLWSGFGIIIMIFCCWTF